MATPAMTNNSPAAGNIAWAAFTIQYQGVAYPIGAGSTAQRWVWWRYNGGAHVIEAGADIPVNLTDDDLVLFGNKNGIAIRVQSTSYVDGELLVDGSVFADAIATNQLNSAHIVTTGLDAGVIKFGVMSGDRIEVGSLKTDRIVVGGSNPTPLMDALVSKATDLIVNGTGATKTKYNWSSWNMDSSDAPDGATVSFDSGQGVVGAKFLDELFPVDPTKKYLFSFKSKQKGTSTTSLAYGMVVPYDAFDLNITPNFYMYIPGTLTTLAQPLNPGDTTVTLTSAANWYGSSGKPGGASTHLRSFIFWDYVDPGGKLWPENTYSRNHYGYDLWADGSLSGNVITLRAPWAGPTKPAGTKLSNGSSGGSYMYGGASATVIPQTWTGYSALVTGTTSGGNGASFATGWPPGVAKAKAGFLCNYAPDSANSKHSFTSVSFSDAGAALADSKTAFERWAPTGATTINGGKITTGTIDSGHISTVGLDAQVIKFGTMSGDRIAVNTLNSDHIVTTGLSASVIKFDQMSGDRILANTINTNHIVTVGLSADVIKFNTMSGDRIAINTLNADRIIASTLQAKIVSAGAVNGITITGSTFQTNTGGNRIAIGPDSSVGIIKFYTGDSRETTNGYGFINPGVVTDQPYLKISTPEFNTTSGSTDGDTAEIIMYSKNPTGSKGASITLNALGTGGAVNIYATSIYTTAKISSAYSTWNNVSLTSPYTALSGRTPVVTLDAMQKVYLRGAVNVNGAANGSTCMTLATQYRPTATQQYAVPTNNSNVFASVSVNTNGTVVINFGSSTPTAIVLDLTYFIG